LGRCITPRPASSGPTTGQDVAFPRLHLSPQPRFSSLPIRIDEYHVHYPSKRDRNTRYRPVRKLAPCLSGASNLGFEDLDAFLRVALTVPDNTYVRVKVVSFDNQPLVLAVKTNHHYFPTLEMIKDPNSESGWRRGMEKEDTGPAHPGVHVGVSDDMEASELG